MVTDDGQITNGGLLLCDQGVLKQSRIFCTRWKGNYKGSIEEDALDDKEFQGASLITLLQNAEDFVRNNSKNPWSIRGMTREERSDYPYKAVREVLVNALIHRNYQILGSEIHVEVFDDRLEITSPGGMMNGRRVQDMDIRHIPSMRRNQVISDVFSRLGFMERRGSGIDRILNSYVEVARSRLSTQIRISLSSHCRIEVSRLRHRSVWKVWRLNLQKYRLLQKKWQPRP
mgnify:FL=1